MCFDCTLGKSLAVFSDSIAAECGGALEVVGSTVSWSGDNVFSDNGYGGWGGGALSVASSTLSWTGDAGFSNNVGGNFGGALEVSGSTLLWTGMLYSPTKV